MSKQASPSASHRYGVMVLGMHRSGTSALAGVLGHLGCDLPKSLMEPKPMNAKGFYEPKEISYFNEDLLSSTGSNWFTWQGFNKDWFRSPKSTELQGVALEKLNADFGASRLFVLKDPRLCILFPFWENVFEAAGCKPILLHTHRHPLDVAASLNHWAGYDHSYGLLLWLRYVLEAEAATRGKKRHFVSYDMLMGDWSAVLKNVGESLDISWPRQSHRVSAEIDAFLDADMRHFDTGSQKRAGSLKAAPWVSTAFDIMESWAKTGENAQDYGTLDRILEQFNAATLFFSDIVEKGRSSDLQLAQEKMLCKATEARNAEIAQALDVTTKQARETQHALEAARDETGGLRAELQTRAEALATLEAERTEQSAALQATQARNAEIAQALDVTTKHARETQHALEAARDETGGLRAELLAEKAARTAAEQRIDQLQTEMTAKMTALDTSHERNEVTLQALSATRSDTATLRLALVSQQGVLDALLSERNKLDERNADLAARLDAQEAALLESRVALARLQHEKDQISSALIQRSHEAEDVGREYAESRQKLKAQAATITALGADRDTLAAEQQQTNKSIRLLRVRMEEQLRKEVAEALTVSRNTMDKQFTTLNEEKHALKATILELNTAARHGAAEHDRLATAAGAEKVRAVEQEKRLTAQIAQQKSAVAALEADLQALRSQAQQTKTIWQRWRHKFRKWLRN